MSSSNTFILAPRLGALRGLCLVLLALAHAGCRRPESSASGAGPAAAPPPVVFNYRVEQVYPHDTHAFTEGLLFLNGVIYESTGLLGESSLRRVDLLTGKTEQRLDLAPEYFGEGLAALGGRLYQLTYKSGKAFVYDLKSFKLEREFRYSGEGWGLATDGASLLMTDGSDQIRFIDPATFETRRTLHVTEQGRPVDQLNELEWVKGEIFANVWKTQRVACIDPATGVVRAWVDLSGLLSAADLTPNLDVLNGIAYDPEGDRLFVTGKFWPKMFQIKIVPGKGGL